MAKQSISESRSSRAEAYEQGITDGHRAANSILQSGRIGYGCTRHEGYAKASTSTHYRSGFERAWNIYRSAWLRDVLAAQS